MYLAIYFIGVIIAACMLVYTLDISPKYGITVKDLFYLAIGSLFSWITFIGTGFIWICIILEDIDFSKFWDYEIIKPAYKRKNK